MKDPQSLMTEMAMLSASMKISRAFKDVPDEKLDEVMKPLEAKMWKTEGEKLARYKAEVGDEMFAALVASPSFPQLLADWEKGYKQKVLDEIATEFLKIADPSVNLTKNDVILGMLAQAD